MVTGLRERSNLRGAITGLAIAAFVLAPLLGCGAARRTPKDATGATDGIAEGPGVSRYMHDLADELKSIQGTEIESAQDEIKVVWDSAALFDLDSAMLTPESQKPIRKMVDVLLGYPDTDIVVTGHTHADGAEDYNRKLSERRALSVGQCLIDMGVPPSRVSAGACGEQHTVGTKDSVAGRRSNPCVEIEIRPNDGWNAGTTDVKK